MGSLVSTFYNELAWVLNPAKHGGTRIPYIDYWNILYPVPMAAGMLTFRFLLSRYCFGPFGKYLGIKDASRQPPPPNPVLEKVYLQNRNVPKSQIVGLSKQLDMSEREVERWIRIRKKQDHQSTLVKFSESCWRFTYYTCMFVYGLVVLWDKPWFWDISQCWSGYPFSQPISSDIWWYYMISMSFYWSLSIGQFIVDVKRKDFWQMFIHHTVTILLMSFSWLAVAYRIGTLVLVVHDCADLVLEAAKMAKYANYETTCTAVFCLFAVVWIITRLGVYPAWIVKHAVFDSPKYLPNFPAYYTFNGMLVTLLVLHCFWTYLILKLAVEVAGKGQLEKDCRSSSEESD